MKTPASLCAILLLGILTFGQGSSPEDHEVLDSASALKIAEKALVHVYGKKKIEHEKPLNAVLKDDVWTISGTLHCPNGAAVCVGGVAVAKISRLDGHVISIAHYK